MTLTFIIAALFALAVGICTAFIGTSKFTKEQKATRYKYAAGFALAAFVIVILMGWLGE